MGANEPVNILLVDDQPGKLLSYEAILKDLGENLVMANSAREALEHMLKIEVAVILLDVAMPELDGFEATAAIRAAGYAGPIMGLTGDDAGAASFQDAGADGTFTKPVAIDEFAAFVKETGYQAAGDCYVGAKARKKYNWQSPGFEQDGRHPVVVGMGGDDLVVMLHLHCFLLFGLLRFLGCGHFSGAPQRELFSPAPNAQPSSTPLVAYPLCSFQVAGTQRAVTTWPAALSEMM